MQTRRSKNDFITRMGKSTAFWAIEGMFIILSLILPAVFLSFPTFATTAHPDSTPTASRIHINRNLIADGDELIYGEANIPYATLPETPASQAFMFRIMDSARTVDYGYNVPFVYSAAGSGYNKQIFALYFPPDDAPTWNTELYLRISENPVIFESPIDTDVNVPLSCYTTLVEKADNQIELAQNLIPILEDIETANSISLLTSSSGYTVLTGTGEIYLRGVIRGIQAMAPSLFLVQNLSLNYTDTTWTTAKFDAYEDRFDDTWVGDDMETTGAQFGMPATMIMAFIVTLPLCLGAVIFTAMKFKHTEPGYLICALLLLMTVVMGWVPKAVFASIYQLCGIYIAYLWFYARS